MSVECYFISVGPGITVVWIEQPCYKVRLGVARVKAVNASPYYIKSSKIILR